MLSSLLCTHECGTEARNGDGGARAAVLYQFSGFCERGRLVSTRLEPRAIDRAIGSFPNLLHTANMHSPSSPTTHDAAFALPDHMRCTYRSKACANERARKRNGTVHKLCQEHRIKANINQRNMQKRLRARRQLELASSTMNGVSAPTSAVPEIVRATSALAAVLPAQPTGYFQELMLDSDEEDFAVDWTMADLEPLCSPSELTPEDLEVLQLLWDQQQSSQFAPCAVF